MMLPIQKLEPEIARGLSGVFFDIDGTFTSSGKILPDAYQSLWELKNAGLKVVPITGRPAGWCDHIARMWPVDGVVGENGAFYFWFDSKGHTLKKRFIDPEDIRCANRKRLSRIRDEILSSVSGVAVASDQLYRETDLAIDYCEDVNPVDQKSIDLVCHIFKTNNAQFKISSIHINGWFGNYNKLKTTKIFAQELWGIDLDANKNYFIFCGDSPNDEPMFRYFPYTAGVKNILKFVTQMKHIPTFMASKEGGDGFVEIVKTILQYRA
jgi:HAD superfamily hydrolase (TIGR01484 family)